MPVELRPAAELAALEPAHWPNESREYRAARTALLAEEIELRRHLWRVAEQRRALPPGGKVPKDYRFDGTDGPVRLSDLFGSHDTLIVYCMMYGPQRTNGCPMCSAQLDAWDGEARHVEKRAALAVVARSPIGRILEYARTRNWTGLKFFSDPSGDFWADYNGERNADKPGYLVFQRESDGTIRLFYAAEGGGQIAGPGQDPHNARHESALGAPRHHARGARHRLVSKARRLRAGRKPSRTSDAFRSHSSISPAPPR